MLMRKSTKGSEHLETTKGTKVLFVVENDYYPRDMRVYNECTALSALYSCYVLAPRQRGEAILEEINGVKCIRYPGFEAKSIRWIWLEYINAIFWIGTLVPLICLLGQVRVVHVANPPDFIVPVIAWLKVFKRKLVYDMHDLSVMTFMGKAISRNPMSRMLFMRPLKMLEKVSISLADAVVATNASISEYVKERSEGKRAYVVRNSHPVRYRKTSEIGKSSRKGVMRIGYFGILSDDNAGGMSNLFVLAEALEKQGTPYKLVIVGSGAGVELAERTTRERGIEDRFEFLGYMPLPDAFEVIKDFDFGIVTWGYLEKNHLHTAMKVMDYMVCGVPVCSLLLKEQVLSTGGIGVHRDSFQEIAEEMARLYQAEVEYEALRTRTLERFNKVLAWDLQRRSLLDAYESLLTEGVKDARK
jgi:glycosyltransferase involved in cell wall biosynthesis